MQSFPSLLWSSSSPVVQKSRCFSCASAGLIPASPQGRDLHPSWRHRTSHQLQKTLRFLPLFFAWNVSSSASKVSLLCPGRDICWHQVQVFSSQWALLIPPPASPLSYAQLLPSPLPLSPPPSEHRMSVSTSRPGCTGRLLLFLLFPLATV